MSDFVALYRGRTVSEAELIAVSAEQRLVSRFFTELLGGQASEHEPPVVERPITAPEVVPDE